MQFQPLKKNNKFRQSVIENPVFEDDKPVVKEEIRISQKNFQSPLDRSAERVTKKPFGIYTEPKSSPVQPENFSGYHTGIDFEIFPHEENSEVTVRSVCSGNLLVKRYASGYGGVAVQQCNLNHEPITVVYGHLKSDSVTMSIGDFIEVGQPIGILGKGFSQETDGERKHLHLGFHKGDRVSILGYVRDKSQLDEWIDPCMFFCEK